MVTWIITPHEGIGSLKLGMSSKQILETIQTEIADLGISMTERLQISEDKETDGVTLRYIYGPIFFMVRYRNNKAVEISVDRYLREIVNVVLYDIDVFCTSAENVVNGIKQFSRFECDSKDELLGTNYEFGEIGIRFWREMPFHEKLLEDENYMREMRFVIEEEYCHLYFDIVTVK